MYFYAWPSCVNACSNVWGVSTCVWVYTCMLAHMPLEATGDIWNVLDYRLLPTLLCPLNPELTCMTV